MAQGGQGSDIYRVAKGIGLSHPAEGGDGVVERLHTGLGPHLIRGVFSDGSVQEDGADDRAVVGVGQLAAQRRMASAPERKELGERQGRRHADERESVSANSSRHVEAAEIKRRQRLHISGAGHHQPGNAFAAVHGATTADGDERVDLLLASQRRPSATASAGVCGRTPSKTTGVTSIAPSTVSKLGERRTLAPQTSMGLRAP